MSHLLETLAKEHVRVASMLLRRGDMTLADYLDQIKFTPLTELSEENEIGIARASFFSALVSCLEGTSSRVEIAKLKAEIVRTGVIQTADSCQLLFDKETLSNNLIFALWAKRKGVFNILSQQCSTVRMLMGRSPNRGPGILDFAGVKRNVFGLSLKSMDNMNVVRVGNVSFSEEIISIAPKSLDLIKGKIFSSGVEAFLDANRRIWRDLPLKHKPIIHFVDERLTSLVLAAMLENNQSVLYRIFSMSELLSAMISEIQSFIRSGQCLVLRNTTDLFYASANNQLVPVKYDVSYREARFVNVKYGVNFPATIEEIVPRLRSGNIFPALLLAFLALSILPQIKTFGGASQYEYYREILEVFQLFCLKNDLLSETFFQPMDFTDYSPMLSGILGDELNLQSICISGTNEAITQRIEEKLLASSMRELIGNGAYFQYFGNLIERKKRHVSTDG